MEQKRSDEIADKGFNLLLFAGIIIVTGVISVGIAQLIEEAFQNIGFNSIETLSYRTVTDLSLNFALVLTICIWLIAFRIDFLRYYLQKLPIFDSANHFEVSQSFKRVVRILCFFIVGRFVFLLLRALYELFFS